MVHLNSPSDCLRPPLSQTLPTKCQQLQKGYAECKRGMVDMRKRFRGNQAISVAPKDTTKEGVKAQEEMSSGQLYAGKSAFGGVKVTDGREPEPVDWREAENQKYRENK